MRLFLPPAAPTVGFSLIAAMGAHLFLFLPTITPAFFSHYHNSYDTLVMKIRKTELFLFPLWLLMLLTEKMSLQSLDYVCGSVTVNIFF